MCILNLFLFFLILPFIYGHIWKGVVAWDGIVFTYLSGFLVLLSIFGILGPIMALLHTPTRIQVNVCTIALGALAMIVILARIKGGLNIGLGDWKNFIKGFDCFDGLYIIILALIILIQVFFAVFYDIGAWRSDDFTYVVISSSAIYDDSFYATDWIMGGYEPSIALKYALCGIYVFYTYISVITGLNVSIVEHTICAVIFLLIAYGAFYILSGFLFPKEDKKSRYVFLILLSLLFLFGMYSHYSVTYRLFGVIWQGKAILAVIITPFLLATYQSILQVKISGKRIMFLMMISLATMSLTMGGIITVMVIPGCLTFLHIVRTRDSKSILYLLAIAVVPMIDLMIYLIYK